MSISAVVLAGGKGRRMGGVDKGMVEFLGKPMVAHVLERLRSQTPEILINANREIERYAAFGFPVIQDDIPDYAGPLAGLHKAMTTTESAYILTVPCDAPLLPRNLLAKLMDSLMAHDADIAIAKTGMQAHPVISLCRRALLPSLTQYLQDGGRKVDTWQQQHEVVEVQFSQHPLAFSNINTSDELTSLEQAA